MLKISGFSALIVGLLLAIPLVFCEADAEAGHVGGNDETGLENRDTSDQVLLNRLGVAFQLVDVCTPAISGEVADWCASHEDMLVGADPGAMAANTVTIEIRDETAQTSTLAAIPRTDR